MAVTITTSNHAKYQLGLAAINMTSDTLKIILMNSSFVFNKDTHAILADVTAYQLATGAGYTQNNKVLSGVVAVEDDTEDKATWTFDNPTWTATAELGPIGAYVIYDDTTSDDTILACVDFGTDYTITNGSSFQAQSVILSIG